MRKEENKKYASQIGVDFIDGDTDYDADVADWYARATGMEWEPEKGKRCTMCFDMRMEKTAWFAAENNFSFISTTNATSRWKSSDQVDGSGMRAAARYDGVTYWQENWKDDDMTRRKYDINAQHRFYKQEYCGCSFSLRDVNAFRRSPEGGGLGPISIPSSLKYTDPEADNEEESVENVNKFFAFDSGRRESESSEGRRLQNIYRHRRKDSNVNNW